MLFQVSRRLECSDIGFKSLQSGEATGQIQVWEITKGFQDNSISVKLGGDYVPNRS